MRILVVSNLFPPDYEGGFEMNAFKLAHALRRRGHDVHVATSAFRESYKGAREEPEWVHRIFGLAQSRDGWSTAQGFLEGNADQRFRLTRLHRELPLRLRNIRSASDTLRLAPKNEQAMERLLQEQEFDLGYVFGMHLIGTSVTLPLTRRGAPVVYHYGDEWIAHYARPGRLKKAVLGLLHPVTFRRELSLDLTNVVVVSEFLRGEFLQAGFAPEQVKVIPRGIEFPLAWDVERPRMDPPTLFMASRLAFYKGTHMGIRAAGVLHRKDPERPWRLLIAGEGDAGAKDTFEKMVVEEGVQGRVGFLGKLSREETVRHMREAAAFVSASIYGEPFANTIIEALASGTPLIGSRAGSIEEVVTDGEHGLLYDKADHEALARQMERVLDDPPAAREMARRGVARIDEAFTMDRVLDRTEALFEQAVQAK